MIKISKQLQFFLVFLTITVVGLIFYFWSQKTNIQTNADSTKMTYESGTIKNTGSINTKECYQNPNIEYFMYHYIREADKRDTGSTRDLSVDPKDFRKHLSHIQQLEKEKKIHLMNGIDFYNSLSTGCFPAKNIWIFTSDDGWIDTYANLVPIAKEYHVPFFLGIIQDKIDVPGFITKNQILEISENPLFTIASHSISHRDQSKMTIEEETLEICESKKIFEAVLQKPILSYIYPIGRMSQNSQEIAKKCGYQIAWSTGFGEKWNPIHPSRYDVNRIRIHNNTTTDLFDAILRSSSQK